MNSRVARAGALDGDRHVVQVAGLRESRDVLLPGLLVEVGREKPAGLVSQERVDAHDMVAPQVFRYLLVGHRDECLVGALAAGRPLAGAGTLLLFAQAPFPLVVAGRRVARLARSRVLPAAREDVLTAAEERPKQGHLRRVRHRRRCRQRSHVRPDDALRWSVCDQPLAKRGQPVRTVLHLGLEGGIANPGTGNRFLYFLLSTDPTLATGNARSSDGMVKFGAAQVLLKPASPGTGVIAGGGVRAVVEVAGIRDILSKSLGSDNVFNVVMATFKGLSKLMSIEEQARRRGRSVEDLLPPWRNVADVQ